MKVSNYDSVYVLDDFSKLPPEERHFVNGEDYVAGEKLEKELKEFDFMRDWADEFANEFGVDPNVYIPCYADGQMFNWTLPVEIFEDDGFIHARNLREGTNEEDYRK